MRTKAKVISIEATYAIVEAVRLSACEGCHKAESGDCSVCSLVGGSVKKTTARAENKIGAQVGEDVIVESSSRRMLFYAASLFLLPLLLFAAGFGIAALFTPTLWICLVAGLVGLALTFVGVAIYSKTVAAKRNDLVIVERLFKEEHND